MIITLIAFLIWMLSFKIEMTIKALLQVNDLETKVLIEPKFINFIAKKSIIYLKIEQQKFKIEIKEIIFNPQKNHYELTTNYVFHTLTNSTLEVEIIYQYIQIVNYIFDSYAAS